MIYQLQHHVGPRGEVAFIYGLYEGLIDRYKQVGMVDGSWLDGPTANIRGLWEGYGIRGREGVVREVVATDGCVTAAEDHAKRYFGSSMGAAATVIWKAWWGRERIGRVGLWWWRVRGERVTRFSRYAGTETGDARVGGRSCAEAGRKNMAGGDGTSDGRRGGWGGSNTCT